VAARALETEPAASVGYVLELVIVWAVFGCWAGERICVNWFCAVGIHGACIGMHKGSKSGGKQRSREYDRNALHSGCADILD
jgi:hypothetical protein